MKSSQDARGALVSSDSNGAAGGPRLAPGGGFGGMGLGAPPGGGVAPRLGGGGVGPCQAGGAAAARGGAGLPCAGGRGAKAGAKAGSKAGAKAGAKAAAKKPSSHVSEREEGVVKTIRDTFGFISCLTEPKYGDVYFRLEDVKASKAAAVAVGSRVEFAVDLNPKNGEYRASKVKPCDAPVPTAIPGFDALGLSSFKPSWASAPSSATPRPAETSQAGAIGAVASFTLKPGGAGGSMQPGGGLGGGWGGGASGGGSTSASVPRGGKGAMALGGASSAAGPACAGGAPGGSPGPSRADVEASLFGTQAISATAKAALFGSAPPPPPPPSQGSAHGKQARGGFGGGGGGGARERSATSSGGGGQLVSELESGTVCSLKEFFGFIACTSEPRYGDLFFHLDAVAQMPGQPRALPALGTQLEFAVEANTQRSGEYRALRVRAKGSGAATAGEPPQPPDAGAPIASAKKAKAKAVRSGGGAAKVADGAQAKAGGKVPVDSPALASAAPSAAPSYTPFSDARAMLGWLAKRQEEPPGGLLLRLVNFQAPMDDICGRDPLPFDALRAVLTLLASPGVRRSLQREKADSLFGRLLASNLVTQPANLASYLRALPSAAGGPSVRSEGFAAACAVMGEWLTRSPALAAASLPWDALRDATRAASLPWTLEEELATLLHSAQKQASGGAVTAGGASCALSSSGPPAAWADFRSMPIFPSADEILGGGGPPELKAHVVDGQYDSALQYLDTHFRLLREDCLAPLRAGVRAFLGGEASSDVRVYPRCQLVGLHCGREGVQYRVAFRLPAGTCVSWEHSKRLMYGSLCLLSADGFKTLLWATVAGREAAHCGATGGLVDIRFPEGLETRFRPGVSYTLVESAATYFEAYQHVLRALQAVGGAPDALPFADTLLRCRSSVAPPAYLRLRTGADRYVLGDLFPALERETGRSAVHILQDWPGAAATSSLDSSQGAAVRLALTKEVALIQGPPGTGKTYVGLKVVATLLANYRAREGKPILVVTMTNHALDQFLEGILVFEPNLIRVGARSRSDKLASCNLRERAFEAGRADAAAAQSRKALIGRTRDLERHIGELVGELNARELSVGDLEDVAGWEAMANLRAGGDSPGAAFMDDQAKLRAWLQPVTQASHAAHKAAAQALAAAEAGEEPPPPPPPKVRGGAFGRSRAAAAPPGGQRDGEAEDEEEEDALDVDRDGRVVNRMLRERLFDDGGADGGPMLSFDKLALQDGEDEDADGEEEHLDEAQLLAADDVWSLPPRARARLYALWKASACSDLAAEVAEACGRYERLARERRELDEANQLTALSRCAVVGMTTTGVAKYQRLLSALEVEVVVVEEAAEVLEAHLIAALTRGTRHLILIGDHLQLRPGTAVYALAKRYNLDVSLFERLVRNGVEHVTLARQRRMRPPIARLLAPVYPALHDHPDVEAYPPVAGMAGPLFFLSHGHAEAFDGETRSRSNDFEAAMAHGLAVHLLRSGVRAERITVLTTYAGQLFGLRKRFRAPGGEKGLDDIRLCSVDQYQGEENDVIVLSLVRSNSQGDIGFLSVQNRMVVALSRARHGMYILGNGALLAARSPLWKGVLQTLQEGGAVGPALPCLAGPRRSAQKLVHVAAPGDFGGCLAVGYPPVAAA